MSQTTERRENRSATDASRAGQRGGIARRDMANVQAYLDRFATAMTSGDTKTMRTLWQVPAFVVGANMSRLVQSLDEVEQFFAGATDMYHERGIVSTRAEITDLDWIADELVTVRVRWPYLDAHGKEHGEESSSYTLQRDDDGEFKMRVIVMRGEELSTTEPVASTSHH
jgi:hypothetical protein